MHSFFCFTFFIWTLSATIQLCSVWSLFPDYCQMFFCCSLLSSALIILKPILFFMCRFQIRAISILDFLYIHVNDSFQYSKQNQTFILSCLTSNKTQCPRDTEKDEWKHRQCLFLKYEGVRISVSNIAELIDNFSITFAYLVVSKTLKLKTINKSNINMTVNVSKR